MPNLKDCKYQDTLSPYPFPQTHFQILPGHGNLVAIEETVGIVGDMGVDAHAPNAPDVIVPNINSFQLPRAVNRPSRDLPENLELYRELSNLYRNSDENFLEQQNYLGPRNLPSQDIPSMISGVRHDDQELDHYDSSPDILNEFQMGDQENPSLEELQESGQGHGNLVGIEETVGIVGDMGVDAHAPNAPDVIVPNINYFPLPRAVNRPSRDLPENLELYRELSNLYRNSDENFLEQQNFLGPRNLPSQDIPSMISRVRHDDQELDHYDSSPDILNEFQMGDQENPSLEELQESGQGHGNLVGIEVTVGIVGDMGVDAHAPNAPDVIVPNINSFQLPRAVNRPSRDLCENLELYRELSNLYRNSDENFLEQQNYLGPRNLPSQDIPSMISRVRHDDQELDHYDSSPDILNEFQMGDQENPSLEEIQESGQAHGHLVAIEEAVGIVGDMGVDAHAPNAPDAIVPSIYSFQLPRLQDDEQYPRTPRSTS
ncbi:uncharacterized protein LOC125034373 [Penaeus chinensis]|uniref:uncharacterized protein LOC125034373 n=1 Tax=Penaeus chinensis TaxID=139456 RepID=UPI001FB67FC8|nr:uncharacterized protein LOC125034373 [Penaeus chinensis]